MKPMFSNQIIGLLAISCLLNVMADVFLFWGYVGSNTGLDLPALQYANLTLLQTGAFAGFLTIPFWLLPAFVFFQTPMPNRRLLKLLLVGSFSCFVLGVFVFHVGFAYVGNAFKLTNSPALFAQNQKVILVNGAYNSIFSSLSTLGLVLLRRTRVIYFPIVCYLLLPLPSFLIFQVLIGQTLPIPAPAGGYIGMVMGTFAVLAFFLSLRFYKSLTV